MRKFTSRWIANNAIEPQHLAASAKQAVLETKLIAQRAGILDQTITGTVGDPISSIEITSALEALLSGLNLPATARSSITAGLGYYAGTISSAADVKKTLIRLNGTDNGIVGSESEEIYGVVTETTGTITLSFKNADGTAYSFISTVHIDAYPVIITDVYKLSDVALLYQAVSGVVDANQAVALAAHLNGSGTKHEVGEIGTLGEFTGLLIPDDSTISAALQVLETAVEGIAIENGSITTEKISNGAITSPKLAASVVDDVTIELKAQYSYSNIVNFTTSNTLLPPLTTTGSGDKIYQIFEVSSVSTVTSIKLSLANEQVGAVNVTAKIYGYAGALADTSFAGVTTQFGSTESRTIQPSTASEVVLALATPASLAIGVYVIVVTTSSAVGVSVGYNDVGGVGNYYGLFKFTQGDGDVGIPDCRAAHVVIKRTTLAPVLAVKDSGITGQQIANGAVTDAAIYADIATSKVTGLDAALSTATNAAEVSSGEITAGTEVALRSYSPKDVKDSVATYSPAEKKDTFTLSATNISNEYLDLSYVPVGVVQIFFSGFLLRNVTDYSVSGNRVTITNMVADLIEGDVLEVYYFGSVAA